MTGPSASEPFTVDAVRALFAYDPETGIVTNRVKRAANAMPGKPVGARSGGYLIVSLKPKRLKVHRLAWALHYGEWPREHIDHVNGDGIDNRIANLREATQVENMRNASRGVGKSGFRGVHKHGRRWRAGIHVENRKVIIGSYETAELAAAAYEAAALKHFGQFAFTQRQGASD
jgi:hypothetical protein